MTEQEMANRYVLKHLESNKEFRLRLSELFIGIPIDVDAEYLLTSIKVGWPQMSNAEKLNLSQAVAGSRYYNAFIQLMDSQKQDEKE
jgi:hypothetical protein